MGERQAARRDDECAGTTAFNGGSSRGSGDLDDARDRLPGADIGKRGAIPPIELAEDEAVGDVAGAIQSAQRTVRRKGVDDERAVDQRHAARAHDARATAGEGVVTRHHQHAAVIDGQCGDARRRAARDDTGEGREVRGGRAVIVDGDCARGEEARAEIEVVLKFSLREGSGGTEDKRAGAIADAAHTPDHLSAAAEVDGELRRTGSETARGIRGPQHLARGRPNGAGERARAFQHTAVKEEMTSRGQRGAILGTQSATDDRGHAGIGIRRITEDPESAAVLVEAQRGTIDGVVD